jgi:hypothetical protein
VSRSAIAWAAGIIDGEGCISIRRKLKSSPSQQSRSATYRLELSVKMTHKPTIERLQSVLSAGNIYRETPGKNNKKVAWKLSVTGLVLGKILARLNKHLVTKLAESKLGFEFLATFHGKAGSRWGRKQVPADIIQKRDALYWQVRELKKTEWK